MMIQEKRISSQFLLDLKNDRSNIINAHHTHQQTNISELNPQQHVVLPTHYLNLNHHHHHHHLQHQQHPSLQHQPPSPPMDIYAAYAYQQQQQHYQLMNFNKHNTNIINNDNNETESRAEVLDLSRRCDSVETPRKTPSPAQTNSSIGTASPENSPQNRPNLVQQPVIPSNLLYSTNTQHNMPTMPAPFPAALAQLYPALYLSSSIIKPEPKSCNNSPSTTPPPTINQPIAVSTPTTLLNSNVQLAIPTATDLLQTFVTATTSPKISTPTTNECKSPSTSANINGSSSANLSTLTTLDEKNMRPFKALPRDPLVVAANFAATDVLLDDERVERYTEYRKRVLEHIRNSNGGTRTVTNPKMRRMNSRNIENSRTCRSSSEECLERNSLKADESSDCESNADSSKDKDSQNQLNTSTTSNGNGSGNGAGIVKDAAYLERRRKNNAAAKKSRDRRRLKEDELAIRAEYLARENYQLLCEIKSLKAQLATYTSKAAS